VKLKQSEIIGPEMTTEINMEVVKMKDGILRIGLVGAGAIGRTHIERINTKLQGAKVVACADRAAEFGLSVAQRFDIRGFQNTIDLINDPGVDAVMCTSADPYHEEVVLASIKAGKYVFCEKPLAPKADACKRIVDAEIAAGRKLVQVGFMRRYDYGYLQLKEAIDSGKYGEPLLLHCAHRNPAVPDDWDNSMAVENSLVHEIDVLRWLLGEDYATAEVRYGKNTRRGPKDLHDPQIMILTTRSGVRIDVESFVNNHNDYDIKCEIVCEDAVLNMPKPAYISVNTQASIAQGMYTDCYQRFGEAYDAEIRAWIGATKEGRVDGPTAWDGYACQVAAAAASKARETQSIVEVVYDEMPEFYKNLA
jgi:myo-inositol 2-dehydrogenase/D-chiro-inositol 1-dehydrogenase